MVACVGSLSLRIDQKAREDESPYVMLRWLAKDRIGCERGSSIWLVKTDTTNHPLADSQVS